MKHRSSKASLFLMELIITILIFSAASAVCVQLFAKSHLISLKTQILNHAVIHSENTAEVFLSTQGDLSSMMDLLDPSSLGTLSDSSFCLYYDENFNPATESSSLYKLQFEKEAVDSFIHGTISFFDLTKDSGDPIYQLKVTKYVGGDFLE